MTVKIKIPNSAMQEVKALLEENKKIAAIKLVRNVGKIAGRGPDEHIGLKEAKHAIDHMSGHSGGAAVLIPEWTVHSVIVTGSAGEKIELDVENLQMHFLTTLGTVGLEEVAHLMDLVDYVKAWQQGGRAPAATLMSEGNSHETADSD